MLFYLHKLPSCVLRKFYISCSIRPRLEYCSAVWSGAPSSSLSPLEKLQIKVARAILYQPERQPDKYTLESVNFLTQAWRRRDRCLALLHK